MKLLFILFIEFLLIKMSLAFGYILYFNKGIFDKNYICRGSDISNTLEYSCNLLSYSFNSTIGTIGNWISIFIILITLIIYFIIKGLKKDNK